MRALALVLLLAACPTPTTKVQVPVPTAPTEIELDGLVWLAGPTQAMTWDEARAYCAERGMGLMEQNNLMLALLQHPVLNTPQGSYWSNGVSNLDDQEAYVSFFADGQMGATLAPRSEEHLVRCVRLKTRVE